jgi:hypothetical protein
MDLPDNDLLDLLLRRNEPERRWIGPRCATCWACCAAPLPPKVKTPRNDAMTLPT